MYGQALAHFPQIKIAVAKRREVLQLNQLLLKVSGMNQDWLLVISSGVRFGSEALSPTTLIL